MIARLVCLIGLTVFSLAAASKELNIYFIDVEGGKSVLLVAPSGQSMLFDAGWTANGRNPSSTDRIVEAVKAAGLKRIDILVVSHFDIDHIGDVPELAAKIPIGHIFDHGEIQFPAAGADRARAKFAPYGVIREKIGHTTVHPGDVIPIKGLEVRVLSAGGQLISKPLPGAGEPNPLCAENKQADALPSDIEDDQSIGLMIRLGKFRMLDLADLEAHLTHDLVCPNNLIGKVGVYNVNVHGQFKGIAPELTGALQAPVIIQANGARKGADAKTWPVLRAAPGMKDIWQLHTSLNAGKDENPPEDFIANTDGADTFKWIHIAAGSDGAFTVTNSRNGFSKKYRE